MKRILLWAVLAVVAVVIVGVIILSSIDVNKYRPKIEAELQSSIHREVKLGNMDLKIFPLSVKINGLTVSEDPAFPTGKPFATATDVSASAGLLSLIRGEPEIRSVTLTQPKIEVFRNAAGKWNFSSMLTEDKSSSGGSNSNLTLEKLQVQDGLVGYTDALNHLPRAEYDHIGVELSGYAPHKPFGLNLDVHFPGGGDQLLSLKSTVGPLDQATPANTPVKGSVSLKSVTLSGISRFAAGSIPPNTDSTISGDADINSNGPELTAKGNLKLANTTVRGSKIDYPVEATFDVANNRSSDILNIRTGDVKIGSTPFSLSGTVDSAKTPANLDVKLVTKDASITDLAKLAGSLGFAFNPAYQVKGRISADITARGPSSSPQLSGKLAGSSLEIAGGEIKQPVQVSALDLTLSPTSVVAAPFTAQSGSTRLDAAFTATNYSSNNPLIDATLKTANADIAELVNMAKAYGMEASNGMSGSGKLTLNVHVQGPVKETAKLQYSGSGAISGATVNAPSALTKPIAISKANVTFAQNSVGLQDFALSVGDTHLSGNVTAQNLAAPQVSFNLHADKLNTAELQQLTAVPAKPNAPKQTQPPSQNEPSLLSRTSGSGKFTAGTVVANEFVLSNVDAAVKLNKGLITLSPLTANLLGGSESGTITLDTRPALAQCGVNAKLANVDTNALLSAVSTAKDTLYGRLAANANMNFTLTSSNDLARTLNGTLAFNVTNGELKRVNILNEISRVAKFLNPGAGGGGSGNSTALTKLSGSMNIRSGEASTNDLTAAMNGGSLSGKGTVNLASQALNMDVNAVLSSGVSSAAGGTKVGGFLNTALANNKGELVVPVKVTGTLQHPTFVPDTAAIAQMKLKNLLPTTGNPAAGIAGSLLGGKAGGAGGAVGGLLNGLGGNTQKNPAAQGQQQQQQNPADAVKGLLGGFKKKKPQ